MPLTCECSDDYDWFYNSPTEFSILQTINRRKCKSCKQFIEIGAVCLEFFTFCFDENGDERYKARQYLCEKCGEIFVSLEDLGFCMELGEDVRDLLKEYHEVYGKK